MLHFFDVVVQQALGQRNNVRRALAQRAPGQREDREPVEQIFTKAPRRHFTGEVAVGGGDHADIQLDRLARADALDFALLQHPQQFGLQAQGHLRDFIEQDRAAVGLFELARLGGDGTGERAFFVTEQRRFEHVVGDRRAVDGDERLLGAGRLLVDIPRKHLFTGTRFAGNQHRGITARHPSRQLQQLRTGRFKGNRALAVAGGDHAQGVPCHQLDQRLGFERLDQVIRRALAHRVHRPLHRAVGGHQQHRQLRLTHTQQAQQLVAVHARHVHIADHQAEGLLLDRLQGVLGRTDRPVVMARQQQRVSQCFTQGAIVFHQQNLDSHDSLLRACRA
ncbi:hypothetical protein PFWH6_4198 [Pseudomonas fluorescens WH6]|nr:hypothetical protein PFWH6_4198 [Pseudomonas fluorescens WH6]